MLLFFLLFLLFFILQFNNYFLCQENVSNIIIGKWQFYVTDKKNSNITYESKVIFEFLQGGESKYYNPDMRCNDKEMPFSSQSWELNNNKLVFGDSKWCPGVNSQFPEYIIKWINKDLFYSEGKEGKRGPKIYSYFKRIN